MSGGKGGSTTSEVTVPKYIEDAARANLAKAAGISEVGYTPYYGPDVAAFNPMQQAMFQNTSDVANAFGMATPTDPQDIMGNMGRPQTYANGVTGYSSAPMFQDAVDTLGYFRPNQKALMDSFFVNPNIGFDKSNTYFASPGSGVSQSMMGRNPSFMANTTNYGADSDYYGTPVPLKDGYDTQLQQPIYPMPIAPNLSPEDSQGELSEAELFALNNRKERDQQRQIDAQRANMITYGSNLSADEINSLSNKIKPNYNIQTDTIGDKMTPDQRNDLTAEQRMAQEDLAMNMRGVANMGFMDGVKNITNIVPTSFSNPSSGRFFGGLMPDGTPRPDNVGGSYGGSLMSGQMSNLTGVPGLLSNPMAALYSGIDPEGGVDMQTAQMAKRLKQAQEDQKRKNDRDQQRQIDANRAQFTKAAGKKAAMIGFDE
jgi:hypothetical protein